MIPATAMIDWGNRRAGVIAGVYAALLVALIGSYIGMESVQAAAAGAAKDFAACDQAASAIQALRQRLVGPVVAVGAAPVKEITSRIEQAAAASNLPSRDIKSVSPLAPQRMQNSPYSSVSTQIEIGDATLGQVTAFIGELCPTGGGLRMTSIHLAAAPNAGVGKSSMWTADITIGYTTLNATNP